MSMNLAAKRGRHAVARKRQVAEKRRLELAERGLAARVRRAAALRVRRCFINGDLGGGMVSVVLVRAATPFVVHAAVFLVDSFCLGIKDVAFYEDLESEDFALIVEAMREAGETTDVAPDYARKLLRDASAWAGSIGFRPPRDFEAVEGLFGEIRADACDVEFTFGHNGRPHYVPGPSESRAQVLKRYAQLIAAVGEDGFDFGEPD